VAGFYSAVDNIRNHANPNVKQPFIHIVRMLIQKVIVGPRPGHKPATLQVHGRIASILAAMEASTIMEKQLITLHRHQFLEAEDAGLLDTEAKRKKLLSDFAEELEARRQQWRDLQVSLVAGAGFNLNLRSSHPPHALLKSLSAGNRSGLFRTAA
jgi:hypothetical protein